MALSTYNIEAQQGSDYSASIAYTDDGGDIINLSGYSSRMQVRKFSGSPNAVLSLAHTAGMTISASAGTIDLNIPASSLSAVAPGEYSYDLEIVSGTGVVTKLLQGNFDVEAEVTR